MEEEIGKYFYMFFCEFLTLTRNQVSEFIKVVNFIKLSSIGLVGNNLRMIGESWMEESLDFEFKPGTKRIMS